MLNKFLKAIKIGIMSGTLLLLDFSMHGNLVYAQTSTTTTPATGPKTQSVTTGGNEAEGGMMKTVEMLAIGLLTSRLLFYGKVTTDIMAAAAGGAAFIAAEILTQDKLKEAAKKKDTLVVRKANGELEDGQIASLFQLRKLYADAKDAAETKKTIQQASAVAFTVAAGLAYFYVAADAMATQTCTTSLVTAQGSIPMAHAECSAAEDVESFGSAEAHCSMLDALCELAIDPILGILTGYEGTRIMPQPSATAFSETTSGRGVLMEDVGVTSAECEMYFSPVSITTVTSCTPIQATHLASESGFIPGGLLTQIVTFVPILATMGITDGENGLITGGIVAAIVAYSTELATKIDTFIYAPTNRAILWALLGAATYMASESTDESIKSMDTEMKKIDDLSKAISVNGNGSKTEAAIKPKSENVTMKATPIDPNKTASSEQTLSNGATFPCVTNPASTKPGDCPSFSSQLNSLSATNNFPDALATSLNQIGQMGNGVNGSRGLSSQTISSANSLRANAAAIKKAVEKLKMESIKKLADAKINFDYNKMEGDARSDLLNSLKNGVANKKTTAQLLASIGTAGFAPAKSTAITDPKNVKVAEALKTKPVVPAMPVIAGYTPPKMGDFKLLEEPAKPIEPAKPEISKEASLENFELKNNDINVDKGENIFNIISSRYQKSAYPRLFERLNE